jgi:predicted amidophosphoribosyltransferase
VSAKKLPWQRCPACSRSKRPEDDLCRRCWKAAPRTVLREHIRTRKRFEKGYVFADRVAASREILVKATREAQFGPSLF